MPIRETHPLLSYAKRLLAGARLVASSGDLWRVLGLPAPSGDLTLGGAVCGSCFLVEYAVCSRISGRLALPVE